MRNPYQIRRRRSPLVVPLLVLFFVVFGALTTGGALWGFGLIRNPWETKKEREWPPGTIPVPLTVQDIPPYTTITRDHLFKPTGEPNVAFLSPKAVEEKRIITKIPELLGRVVKTKRSKGYAFTENDLYPRGTRPGRVAAIDPSQRDFVLNIEKIKGFEGLQQGDRFDLIATVPAEKGKLPKGLELASNGDWLEKSHFKVIVHDGIIVLPAKSATAKKIKKDEPNVTIAVKAEEVPILARALAQNAQLSCVARSGRNFDSTEESTIEDPPPPPNSIVEIEVITGGKREVRRFLKTPEGTVSLGSAAR